MKKALLTTITTGAVTALIAAGTPAMAAEVTYGRWANDNNRYCNVTFTAAESTNLARILKGAGENYREVFNAERGRFTAAELAFLDHTRIYHADRTQIFFEIPLADLTDEEIAASDARGATVRQALVAELDPANGPVNEQMLEYEHLATELGEADFYATVDVNQLAESKQFKIENSAQATAINPNYSAADELKLVAAGIQSGSISERFSTPALQAASNEFLAAKHAQLIVSGRACASAFEMTTDQHPLAHYVAEEDSAANVARWEEIIASGEVPETAGQEYFYTQPLESAHTLAAGVTLPRGAQDFPNTGNPEFDQSLIGKIFGVFAIIAAFIGFASEFIAPLFGLPGLFNLVAF